MYIDRRNIFVELLFRRRPVWMYSKRDMLFLKVLFFNTYAVQQDTQSVLMNEFIHHVC